MSREIEFRAWLKDEKKMCKVAGIDFSSDEVDLSLQAKYCFYKFKDVELMQYTGLKDKNGVKIFEGDILKHTSEYDNNGEIFEREEILIVKYEKEWCQFILEKAYDKDGNYYSFCEVDLDYLEVIGNIYENKELLEVEDE